MNLVCVELWVDHDEVVNEIGLGIMHTQVKKENEVCKVRRWCSNVFCFPALK